jgi:hypothetical protein
MVASAFYDLQKSKHGFGNWYPWLAHWYSVSWRGPKISLLLEPSAFFLFITPVL